MSKYIKSTTETIIQTLIDGGHRIEYFKYRGLSHSMSITIDGNKCGISGDSFEELNENFISHYVMRADENSKRIDGGCNSPWHTLPDVDKDNECHLCHEKPPEGTRCPGCNHEITADNAGGYRTFCVDCVKQFPDFPDGGKGYTMEIGQFGDFKWVSDGAAHVEPIEPWPRP